MAYCHTMWGKLSHTKPTVTLGRIESNEMLIESVAYCHTMWDKLSHTKPTVHLGRIE